MKHAALLSLSLLACTSSPPAAPHAADACTRFDHVRVFDGARATEDGSVVVRDGRIAEVNGTATCAESIDGRGKTILPGLIDSHVHTWDVSHLEAALRFGVTTELDMMTSPERAKALEQEAARRTDVADLRSAGSPVTSKGGHGTEYGFAVPTLDRAEDADAFVAARVSEGSQYIKIIYTPDSTFFTSITKEMLAASIAAAHARGLMAVVHVDTLRGADDAIEAGVDGLAHLFHDVVATKEIIAHAKNKHVFVVPTLSVLRSAAEQSQGPALLADPALRASIGPAEQKSLQASFGFHFHGEDGHTLAPSVRAFRDAGVPILAGTDAPNPGTAHGVSLHGELELLVNAGLTPLEALASATSVPAKAFHLEDRGTIATGRRADLLVVEGDPTKDIEATRAIVGVWRGGHRLENRRPPAAVESAETATSAPRREVGLISSFDHDMSSRFGLGFKETTDAIMGGTSIAKIENQKGALVVSGTVAPGLAFAWSGVMFNPGDALFAPTDLSAAKELVFTAHGDGRHYQVLLFTKKGGRMPARQSFVAKEKATHRITLSSFGTDGADVTGIAWVAGPDAGTYRLELDDVEIR